MPGVFQEPPFSEFNKKSQTGHADSAWPVCNCYQIKRNSGIAEGYFTMYEIEEIVSDVTILNFVKHVP